MTYAKPAYPWLAMALAALCFGAFHAETALAKTQAIRFQPGSTSATMTGAVIRGERTIYLVGAKAGQTMSVEVSSTEKNAVFQIQIPGRGTTYLPGAGEEDDATSWKGVLPQAGTYKIIVGPTRGNTEYALRVEIKN